MPEEVTLAWTFDSVARQYQRARPGYPAALFDDLAGLCGPVERVLELGPGTGQATRALLARGWRVVGVEPGARLAAVARESLAGSGGELELVVEPFESWRPAPDTTFDLVFAATSWHWLDQELAFGKAASLLRPGGHLAIVTTEHVLPADGDEFFVLAADVYADAGLGRRGDHPVPPEAIDDPMSAAIAGSGHFAAPVTRRYVWSQRYPTAAFLELLGTYSGHIAATARQREVLFTGLRRLAERRGGAVRKHYLNVLHVAGRR